MALVFNGAEWPREGSVAARYPGPTERLASLDLQVVSYTWITGISDVAIVAFVGKRVPEIQYLLASITEEQRQEFGEFGRGNGSSNRNYPICFSQRNPFPAKRLGQLSASRPVPRERVTRRNQTHSSTRGAYLD